MPHASAAAFAPGWAAAVRAWAWAVWFRLESWAEAERGRFALWLPVAMGAGILLDLTARHDPPDWLGAVLAGAGVALTVALRPHPLPRGIAAAVAAAGFGVLSAQVATWRAPPPLDLPRRAMVVTAEVRGLERLPDGARVTLAAARIGDAAPMRRQLRVRLHRAERSPIAPGDTVRLRVLLSPPSPPAYPGAWDLQRDAYFAGMGGYGFALAPAEVLSHAEPSGFSGAIEALRAAIGARIAAVLPHEEGAVATTLLTGSTAGIPEADKAAFRDSGLAHLLAIAGLHIGIVMSWIMLTVRLAIAAVPYLALRWPGKQIAVLAALGAGGFYMLLTGAHVPIIRSFAMACLVALAVLAGRRPLSLRGLALAAAAIMFLAPNEVLGVSFQMSFSAVLALIAGYALLRPVLAPMRGGGWRRVGVEVVSVALTSAIAGTFSAPFAAYHFGRFQIYYVLANMIAVPLTAFWVMPTGMLALLLMPLHLEAAALLPMGWGIDAILWIGRHVAALPLAVFAVRPPPAWGMAVASLGLCWVGLWRTRVRWAGIAAVAAGLGAAWFDHPPDVLASADARLIAAHTNGGANGGVFVHALPGASRFTRDAWLQRWTVAADTPFPPFGAASGGAVSCDAEACVVRPHPDGPAATILRAPPGDAACEADVLIAAEPIRLRCAGGWVPWVDRFDLWRDGAHAIWLDPGGIRIVSDREWRGDRPWVPPPR